MSIEKRTIVDQIEITRDGSIQLRFGLLLIEGDVELDCKWHRTTISPTTDLDAQIAAVNTHLASMGKATVAAADVARVRALLPVVQTPDVIQAYRAKEARSQDAVRSLIKAS